MHHKITTQTPLDETLIPLAAAKNQCRMMGSFTKDDDYLISLISAACELSQVYCNRLLTVGTIAMHVDYYVDIIRLWGGEITSISAISATDTNGDTVEVTDFTFNEITQSLKIPTSYVLHTDFLITYDAGYETLPKKVEHGILLLISTLYNNRDDFITGLSVESMPMTSKTLLGSVKHYVS